MSKAEEQKKELLREVSLFEELEESELNAISPLLEQHKYKRGEYIVHFGAPGDSLYLVKSGKLKVTLFENNREIILSILKEGDFFGEMALLDQKPRSANVIALQATRLYRLSQENFLRFIEARPRTMLHLLRQVSERLRKADEIRRDLVLLDVYGRVASVLLRLAQDEGEQTDEGFVIHVPPSQQQIAQMIGATRETINRVINEFIRSGILRKEGRALIIQFEALQRAKLSGQPSLETTASQQNNEANNDPNEKNAPPPSTTNPQHSQTSET